MRVATFVLGIALSTAGEASEAFDTANGSVNGSATLGAPTERFITPNTSAWLHAEGMDARHGAVGAMAFVPSQAPSSFARGLAPMSDSTTQQRRPYHPANIPLPATRTLEDHLLTGFVALMLIAYQLRRKHRFLRPHQFSA